MFNERDCWCAAVQLIFSTDPSYDNKTINSTLNVANPDGSTLEGTAQSIGRPFGGGGAEGYRQKDPDQWVYREGPIIDETPQPPNRQIAKNLGISHTTVNACVKEDLTCRSYRRQTSQILSEKTKNLRLIKSIRPPDLNPLDVFIWIYVENITNMTSRNTKVSLIAAISRVFAELPPALEEKVCSQFQISIKVVIEAEGGYIESMSALRHNQVSWIDFFNKSF